MGSYFSFCFLNYKRLFIVAIVFVFFTGCSVLARERLLSLYGPESVVQDRILPVSKISPPLLKEWHEVKEVLDKRCVVCHSCYDAPCQLKLTSPAGIDRGVTTKLVYDGTRFSAVDPTRLYVDAQSTFHWRLKGFSPILNERMQNREANLQASLLYRLLELKRNNPLPAVSVLPSSFDFSIDREQRCPALEELDYHEKVYPLWGMPFGLPAISDQDFAKITIWLEHGAYMPAPAQVPPVLKSEIVYWEAFLNSSSPKEQLVARYIYEHLFSADIYFDDVDKSRSFRLIRSFDPPTENPVVDAQKIGIIPSRRPTEDPKVAKVYYRFAINEESLLAKTHMPYALNKKRMERFKELFVHPRYTVDRLPSYQAELATNPFATFKDIPVVSRYRFLLDEAQYFISGFIKGPVCRGQVALNVIEDRFWVLFIDPKQDPFINDKQFLSEQSSHLRLPAAAGSNPYIIVNWLRYSKEQKKYIASKRDYLKKLAKDGYRPTLDKIWFGHEEDTNAALTVFRHYDSATVVRGLVGKMPKNAWILDYSLFERMHYLLAVDFDVFGNVGHQLLTRLYMDFLRAEAENNFLVFLPKNMREKEHDFWYRGIGSTTNEYMLSSENFDWTESGIQYLTKDPKEEFFSLIRSGLGKALDTHYLPAWNNRQDSVGAILEKISNLSGLSTSFLPELSYVRVINDEGKEDAVYTLLLNRSHGNVAVLYLENLRLLPDENDVTFVPGFIGSYPNAFFVVNENDLGLFLAKLQALRSELDYTSLLDSFGVRRTNSEFWQHSDWFQSAYKRAVGNREILDYSRLENR